jgi:hypothetical protein
MRMFSPGSAAMPAFAPRRPVKALQPAPQSSKKPAPA